MDLNKKDLAILSTLSLDARQPVTQIARKLRISKQALSQRIKKLEKEGLILGYQAIINYSELGFFGLRVKLKLQDITPIKRDELISYLKVQDAVHSVTICLGHWDILCCLLVRDLNELNKVWLKFLEKFRSHVVDRTIYPTIEVYSFAFNFEQELKKERKQFVCFYKQSLVDKTTAQDKDLLVLLRRDARLQLQELAGALNVPAIKIKERMQKLKQAGVIQGYRPVMNFEKMGYKTYRVFLMLQSMSKTKEKSLLTYLSFDPRVIAVMRPIGREDYEFTLLVKEEVELENFLIELKKNMGDIIKGYEVLLCLRDVYKNGFTKR